MDWQSRTTMFTGIIEEIGIIKRTNLSGQSGEIQINASKILKDCHVGDSIAVDGACLTVVNFDQSTFTVDVSAETLRRTTLRELQKKSKVNLERSLKLSNRLGGHLVLGHVDEVGKIISLRDKGESTIMQISASQKLMRYVAEKGSICVDGVSLTISNLTNGAFEVVLIPHTKSITTLGNAKTTDHVNLEADLLARYIDRLFISRNGSINGEQEKLDLTFLEKHGFLN